MFNCYGQAKFVHLSHEQVWSQVVKPLKTGALWMTEMASTEEERRGTGLNRWLLALVSFCDFQLEETTVAMNKFLMKPEVLAMVTTEINEILPALKFILAPKKQFKKDGAAVLRRRCH